MDSATLRTDLPEFTSTTTYPDATVNFWLSIGVKLLNARRWGDLLDHGLELFTAHHLILAQQNVAAAKVGGAPGVTTGVVSSKGVDKLNISYVVGDVIEEKAGHWNLTTYGLQFIHLARMVGMGGYQVTGNC